MIKNISNLGDSAIYCDFGPEVSKKVNLNIIKYFQTLREKKIKKLVKLLKNCQKLFSHRQWLLFVKMNINIKLLIK